IYKSPVFLPPSLRDIRKLFPPDDDHAVFLLLARMQDHIQALNFVNAFRPMRFDARTIEEIDVALFENLHETTYAACAGGAAAMSLMVSPVICSSPPLARSPIEMTPTSLLSRFKIKTRRIS